MLRRLLRLAAARGSIDINELAAELETRPAMVEQMLERLQQEGYLRAVVRGCSLPCERCPLRAACLYRRQPRIWSLTARGERWLEQEGEK